MSTYPADEGTSLSLCDLEAGRIWGEGNERRAVCPFCGDEHKRDREHASLAVNVATGAWVCHRCGASGILEDNKTHRAGEANWPPHKRQPSHLRPAPAPVAAPPIDAGKRETLRRLWRTTWPIGDAASKDGADYLAGRGLPLDVAVAARVRYSPDWYGRPAVVFPLQNAAGRLVAAESRYVDSGAPKSRSAGPKSQGVFEAAPESLTCDYLALCEGPITALSVAACGVPAVALCGRTMPAWLAGRLLAVRVFVALDWYEAEAERKAAAIVATLTAAGARTYKLSPPGERDWNDHLQRVGLASMRASLGAAVTGAVAGWR